MKISNQTNSTRRAWAKFSVASLSAVLMALPFSVMAAAPGDATGTSGAVCLFFGNINTILNIASLAVVTIAVIFAGYQIAFAHKRISDVAPVLIGACLIGGASQFAKMLLPDGKFTEGCMTAMLQVIQPLYA